MSAPRRPPPSSDPAGAVPEDEYARAYSEGYGEGLREALREVLQHASRGHTASELRLLIESRLARVKDDIELKRKSVLSPPRRPSWGAILRPPSTGTPVVPPAWELPVASAGDSFLFKEERPARGLACVDASAAGFRRVLAISLRPPRFASVSPDHISFLQVATGEAPGAIADPGRLAGAIKTAIEADGSVLVYFDAFDTMATEAGVETMLRFVTWLTGEAIGNRSAAIVSLDPAALDTTVVSRLQRAFKSVP